MFAKFDGTGRQPRQVQKDVFSWLEKNWQEPVLAINAPTGIGKSAVLRALQLEFPGTMGIIPTNILIDQYRGIYPDLNYLKGKDHYDTETEYVEHRSRAQDGEATIFNPMSLFSYARPRKDVEPNRLSDIGVIDEAHKLLDFVNLLTSGSFKHTKFPFPSTVADSCFTTIQWLQAMARRPDLEWTEQTHFKFLARSLAAHPQDYVVYIEKRKYYKNLINTLHVRPLVPSKLILSRLLGFKKLILMSATLLHSDLWDLNLTHYKYLDMPSPINKENRKVLYRPAALPFNFRTKPEDVAKYIKETLTAYPGLNTIVHVSYGWAEKLRPFFPNALFNLSSDKHHVLQDFKANGGVWIASGCAEGIDLPGDECRLTIIPMVIKPNIKDPVIAKLLTRELGQVKYDLQCVKQLIQQVGRGTRGEDDFSTTIVGDQMFPRLITANRQYLPKSFLEAIQWRKS